MSNILYYLFFGEAIILSFLIIILLILIIWWLLRKIVVVPTITVGTDQTSYFRGRTVTVSGNLKKNGTPMANETISLAIQPPTGDAYTVPNVVTDVNGNFTSSWIVPVDAVIGTYTLTASGVGVSATTTFTY